MATMNDAVLPGPGVSSAVDAETYESLSPKVVALTDPQSLAAEQYRVLRYRVECLARSGFRALAFSSAQRGEGRTTTVVNLALELGRGGRYRVVLVDADLRRPGVHNLLGLRPQKGLCEGVAGSARLEDRLWRLTSDALEPLPA